MYKMAESGCLRDAHVQNLEVSGVHNLINNLLFPTAARTALTVDTGAALQRNQHYTMLATATAALTLPAQSTCVKGDFITLVLTGPVDNGATLKIGTSGEFFTAGSQVRVVGQDGTRIGVVDHADGTADDFINIVGLTAGDGGTGSTVSLVFNGSTWTADAVIEGQGAQSAASASTVFAAA
jgi:hypothetical protein